MESTNNSPDVSHSSLRLSERLATPYRSFSNLRGFGKLGTEICSHEKNPEVSHSSPPSRFSQASGSPPLLSYGGSCPHRAAYLHRRTQRRTAPVFLSVSRQRVCVRGGHVCGAPRPGAARRPREHCSAQLPACAERRPQGGGWPALFCWLVHWVWRCKLH